LVGEADRRVFDDHRPARQDQRTAPRRPRRGTAATAPIPRARLWMAIRPPHSPWMPSGGPGSP
jgi:hypothetical protein